MASRHEQRMTLLAGGLLSDETQAKLQARVDHDLGRTLAGDPDRMSLQGQPDKAEMLQIAAEERLRSQKAAVTSVAAEGGDPNVYLPKDRGILADPHTYQDPPQDDGEEDSAYATRKEQEWEEARAEFVKLREPVIRGGVADWTGGGVRDTIDRTVANVRSTVLPFIEGVSDTVTGGAARELGASGALQTEGTQEALEAVGKGDSAEQARASMAASPVATTAGQIAGFATAGLGKGAWSAGNAMARHFGGGGVAKALGASAGLAGANAITQGIRAEGGGAEFSGAELGGAAIGGVAGPIAGGVAKGIGKVSAGLQKATSEMGLPSGLHHLGLGALTGGTSLIVPVAKHVAKKASSLANGAMSKYTRSSPSKAAIQAGERLIAGYEAHDMMVPLLKKAEGALPISEAIKKYGAKAVEGMAKHKSGKAAKFVRVADRKPSDQKWMNKLVSEFQETGAVTTVESLKTLVKRSPDLKHELEQLMLAPGPKASKIAQFLKNNSALTENGGRITASRLLSQLFDAMGDDS